MPTVTAFSREDAGEAPVRGLLHRASVQSSDALVLTHGAGGNCHVPLLVDLAETFAASGINVLRCDLPFRQVRPNGPPSPSNAQRDQDGLRQAVRLLKEQFPGRIFLGGQSYGGRQASLLAAAEPLLVSGLLLLSYPLHPPGRPAQMRTAHFPNLHTPALFFSGTKDAFGAIEELEAALRLIPATTRLVPVPTAGHSLATKVNRQELPATVVAAFRSMYGVP